MKRKWLAILRDPRTSTPWEHPELPVRTFRTRAASERAAERAPRELMEEYWAQRKTPRRNVRRNSRPDPARTRT